MRQYNFGECIPESIKVYNKLKAQGKRPKLVEGWVEVDYNDLEPNREFLELYYPDILKIIDNDLEFDDYIRVLPHTWVILDNEYIDITRNQFDKFGGIIKYYEKMRYRPKPKIKLEAFVLQFWYDERDYIEEKNKYIRFPVEDLVKIK